MNRGRRRCTRGALGCEMLYVSDVLRGGKAVTDILLLAQTPIHT
jgi:hypothetical protein